MIATGLTACNLLDLEPKSEVSLDDYFKTESDLEMFSNPFYNNLLDKAPFDDQSDVLVELILDEIMEGGDRRTVPASGSGCPDHHSARRCARAARCRPPHSCTAR